MKSLFKVLTLATLVTCIACEEIENPQDNKPVDPDTEKPVDPDQPAEPEKPAVLEFTATLPAMTADTKEAAGPATLGINWEEGDKIIAVGFDGNSCKGELELTLTEGAGTQTASFTGTAIADAGEYVLYFKTAKLAIDEKGTATIDYAGQQIANDPVAQAKPYLKICSDKVKLEALQDKKEVKLALKNAIMAFHVKGMHKDIKSLDKATWICNYGTQSAIEVPLTVAEGTDLTKLEFIGIVFDPATITKQNADEKKAVRIENGNTYIVSGVCKTAEEYKEGGIYKTTIAATAGEGVLGEWRMLQMNDELWLKTVQDTPIPTDQLPEAIKNYVKSISSTLNDEGFWVVKTVAPLTVFPECALEGVPLITEIIFPEGMTIMQGYSLKKCTNLKKITFPQSLEKILEGACEGAGIETLEIPANVSYMEADIFKKCPNLKTVTIKSKCTNIPRAAFFDCNALKTVNLSKSVKQIDKQAFFHCGGLQTINLEQGSQLETIGEKAFESCSALASFPLFNQLKNIGTYAFGSTGFKEVTIPDGCTVGEKAFDNCYEMTKITISKNVKAMADAVFYTCLHIKDYYILAGPDNAAINDSSLRGLKGKYMSEWYTDYNNHDEPTNLHLNKAWNALDAASAGNKLPKGNEWLGFTWNSISFVNEDGTPVVVK